MDRLIVNGENVDLYEGTEIHLTMQLADVGDISTRNSTYSNTITAPRTAKNRRIFKHVGVYGNTSRTPYKNIHCQYIKGTTTVIGDGVLVLMESTEKDYKFNLFDGIINLQEVLGDKKLNDLDFTALNHQFTKDTYLDSFDHKDGYIYAAADFGNFNDDHIQIANQAPSVYAHTLFDMIFTQNNLTKVGEFFDSNVDWKNYVVSPARGFNPSASSIAQTIYGSVKTPDYPDYKGVVETKSSFFTRHDSLNFEGSFYGGSGSTNVGGVITVGFTGLMELWIDTEYLRSSGTLVRFILYKNSTIVPFWSTDLEETDGSTPKTFNVKIPLQVTTGDNFRVGVYTESRKVSNPTYYAVNYALNSMITLTELTPSGSYYDVEMKDLISNMTQLDFIKDMVQRYGLIIRQNRKGVFEFRELRNLLDFRDNAVDYSKNLISDVKETFNSGYAQNNHFKYKYPSEVSDFDFDGTLLADSEVLPLNKDVLTSNFEIPTVNDAKFSGREIVRCPIWSDKLNSQDIAYEKKDNAVKYLKVINGTAPDFRLKYFTEPVFVQSGNTPTLSLEDVGYNYFLEVYYSEFKLMLDSYKEVEVEFHMTPQELINVDFFKLIYLQKTGRYYYIDNLKVGRTVKAKLIEISKFINRVD